MNYGSSLKSNLSLSVIDVILVQSRKRNLSQSTQIGGGANSESRSQVCLLILFALRLIATLNFVVYFSQFGMRYMFLSVSSASLCFSPWQFNRIHQKRRLVKC